MENSMLVVGLTGPTGAGKGIISGLLEKNGIPVIDTDKVSRLVCEKGKPCLSELAECFGVGILTPSGNLDRKALAREVFESENHTEKLKKLNAISHKHILAYVDEWLDKKRAEGCSAAAVDAPQLFESGFDKKCDLIIGVVADKNKRIERIKTRDNIDTDTALARIESQHSDSFFEENCTLVFHNDKSRAELENDMADIIQKLRRGECPC